MRPSDSHHGSVRTPGPNDVRAPGPASAGDSQGKNCGHRTTEIHLTAGFRRQAKACSRCGFGFLFELLDDYYPAPDAAFFVCDSEGRVIGCGRGSFELTGLDDERVIGRQVRDVLGLRFENADDPVGTVLEWGVRALNKPVQVNAEGDLPARATADLFPPTMTTAACCWSSLRPSSRPPL